MTDEQIEIAARALGNAVRQVLETRGDSPTSLGNAVLGPGDHNYGSAFRAGSQILDGTAPPGLGKLARMAAYLNTPIEFHPDGTVVLAVSRG